MQFGESLRELKLLAVNRQRTIGAFLTLHGILRQANGIDTEEIAHTRFLQLQVSGHAVERHHVNCVLLHRTEYPLQHIVEMYADIRGYTATLVHIAFPTAVVPLTATGDIGQVHIVDLVFGSLLHFLLERTYLVVQTELQDRVGLLTGLLFQLHQVVYIVRIEHQRLLANHVAAQTQAVTDERIVRIVRRTDGHPLQRVVRTHLFRAKTVELLILREERTIRERTVQTTYTVKLVVGHHQIVAGIRDCLDVTRSNVAGGSN